MVVEVEAAEARVRAMVVGVVVVPEAVVAARGPVGMVVVLAVAAAVAAVAREVTARVGAGTAAKGRVAAVAWVVVAVAGWAVAAAKAWARSTQGVGAFPALLRPIVGARHHQRWQR